MTNLKKLRLIVNYTQINSDSAITKKIPFNKREDLRVCLLLNLP